MTVFFFVFAILVAWTVYNLYRPTYRRAGPATASFAIGWLTGELALHHIAWQMLVVFALVWAGAVQGILGAVGFLLCAVSWLAAGYFYFTGEYARPVTERALRSSLGDNYQNAISTEFVARFPKTPNYRRILLPFGGISPDIELIKDIPYGDHGQTLDIYRPRRSLENSPVLLQIHGGAWEIGSKEFQGVPLMTHMALRNWVSISIDYRLSPAATFPDHLVDCKQSLAWIRTHIEKYGGNPDFVVVTGQSAGGHLCSLVALTADDPEYQPGFEEVDTRVQGAVPFYGVYDLADDHWEKVFGRGRELISASLMKRTRTDDRAAFERASPLYRINADAPPFLVFHGDHDSLVPVAQARRFVDRLRAVSKSPVGYAEIRYAQHAFDLIPSLRNQHTLYGVERFLTWLYSGYLGRQRS